MARNEHREVFFNASLRPVTNIVVDRTVSVGFFLSFKLLFGFSTRGRRRYRVMTTTSRVGGGGGRSYHERTRRRVVNVIIVPYASLVVYASPSCSSTVRRRRRLIVMRGGEPHLNYRPVILARIFFRVI